MRTTGLALIVTLLAATAIAAPVRVEFVATLTEGALAGAPASLRGFYEFDDEQVVEITDDRFGVVRTHQMTGFGLTGFGAEGEANGSGPSATLQQASEASPPSAFRIPWINYAVKTLEANDVGDSLAATPLDIVGPSLTIAREDLQADDLDGNGSSGTIRVLADINGDGVIEGHEVIAIVGGYSGVAASTPFLEELTLSFRPIGAALPSEAGQGPPQTLDDIAAAVLRINHREDSPTLQRLGFPSLGGQIGELQYTMTSLSVVPEPGTSQLLAAITLVARRRRRQR